MKQSDRLMGIEALKHTNTAVHPDDMDWLIARVKRLEAALKAMPGLMYEELLETTAWMGIPEKKRESSIKEQVSNITFIVNKTLEGDDDKI